jgi:HSP20 family protein
MLFVSGGCERVVPGRGDCRTLPARVHRRAAAAGVQVQLLKRLLPALDWHCERCSTLRCVKGGRAPRIETESRHRSETMRTVQLYDPFGHAGLDDLFRGLFRPVEVAKDAAVAIKVDVTEKDNAYVVHAEVPGVKRDDIHVTIEGNQVTIAAEVKKGTDVKDGERALRGERYYGAVYRSFVLPAELDETASEAKYENGVLELKLAKKPALAGRKLTIQ